jgi:hypothetical protein
MRPVQFFLLSSYGYRQQSSAQSMHMVVMALPVFSNKIVNKKVEDYLVQSFTCHSVHCVSCVFD